MAVFYDSIPDSLIDWLVKQHMFWVATAALTGHVNVSPKSTADCFHIVNKNKVWYEDLTGSAIETVTHMREQGNGRITILFHAFEGPPRILRLWGKGTAHEFGTAEYNALIPPEQRKSGSRAAVVVDVHKVGTSCGYAVPLYNFNAYRSQLERWCDSMEVFDRQASSSGDARSASENSSANPIFHPKGIKAWWTAENLSSFDGLPAMQYAHLSPVVPTNTFDRNAPRESGRMIRIPGDEAHVSEVRAQRHLVSETAHSQSRYKSKGRDSHQNLTQPADRNEDRSAQLLGAFILGVAVTVACFKADAIVLRSA